MLNINLVGLWLILVTALQETRWGATRQVVKKA